MPQHDIAEAMADEVQFLDFAQSIDHLAKRLRVLLDAFASAGVAEPQGRVAAIGPQIVRHRREHRFRPSQSVEQDDDFAANRPQPLLDNHLLESRSTLRLGAPREPLIVVVQ
jgi:hypothetical protein